MILPYHCIRTADIFEGNAAARVVYNYVGRRISEVAATRALTASAAGTRIHKLFTGGARIPADECGWGDGRSTCLIVCVCDLVCGVSESRVRV